MSDTDTFSASNGAAELGAPADEEQDRVRAIKDELASKLDPRFAECDVHAYAYRGSYAICRTLTPDEYQAFKKSSLVDKDRAQSGFSGVEKVFRTAVLWPTGTEKDALLRRRPGLPATIGQQVLEDSGLGDSAEVRKL